MNKPKSVKSIIFDLDGVLVDSIDTWYAVFNIAMKSFGNKKISIDEFKKNVWGVDAQKVFPHYFKNNTDKHEVLNVYNEYFGKELTKTFIFPESLSVLKILKENKVKIAIASNSTSKIVSMVITHTELKQYIDLVLSADMFSKGKPDPEMLLAAIEHFDVKKDETIYVGDTSNDVEAGKSAGLFTVGIGIDADARIEKLVELLPLLGLINEQNE